MDKTVLSAMEKEGLTQRDYLFMLRKFSKIDNLDAIVAHKENTLNQDQLALLYGAADHRRVEILSGRLFDKIPKEYWHLIK